MDLIDQYLRAVAALLPRAQRDDITAELRDIILSRIEAREAALGRPLSDDEIEEELRAVGHPILVAARYRQEPQHLVGPSLYPYWLFAVKIAVTIQVIASLAALVLHTLGGQDFGYSLGQAIAHTLSGSITLIGIATVVAWAVERGKVHVAYLQDWRVRDLKVLEYAGWGFSDLWTHVRQAQRPRAAAAPAMRPHAFRSSPLGKAMFGVTFGAVFLLWWVGVIPLTILAPADGLRRLGANFGTVAGMNLGDLHAMVFWPVLLFSAALIAQGALTLAYPAAARLRALVTIVMSLAMLTFCFWLWTASPIAAAIRVDNVADLLAKLQQALHHRPPLAPAPLITLWILCAAFAAVVQIVQAVWEMLTGTAPK